MGNRATGKATYQISISTVIGNHTHGYIHQRLRLLADLLIAYGEIGEEGNEGGTRRQRKAL